MRRFCAAALLCCLLFSCKRAKAVDEQAVGITSWEAPTVAPMAVLQAGEFPLWFQFTVDGPVLIETIEDAYFSAALVPWPLAPHVRFMLARGGELLIAVNRYGFVALSSLERGRLALYRFSGGEFWRRYTVGAFAFFDEEQQEPAALLYRDDRFLDSDAPLPFPRMWTFDWSAAESSPFVLPPLDVYDPQDGWDIDVLRRGGDGLWYWRAVKKPVDEPDFRPEIKMLRSDLFMRKEEQVSLGAFQDAALPEPLSAAPTPLSAMLAAVFAASGTGLAAVVSPEFPTTRSFATDREKPALSGFYSGDKPEGAFLLATTPQGNALYTKVDTTVMRHFSLPPLPEGFYYTGIGMCGDTIFASWEEQDEYSIGAAGFMVVKR
jgi:hypothetical protein